MTMPTPIRPVFGLALLALGTLVAGPSPRAEEPQEQQLDTIAKQIESSTAEKQRIAAEIAAAVKEQEDVAERLVAVSRAVQAQEATIADSEKELQRLAEERVLLLAQLGEKQDVLSELLAGLQRLERNPPPALVVEPNDVLSALRGAMLLGTIVPDLQAEAELLVAELDRLRLLEAQIAERKTDVAAEMARMETTRKDLNDLLAAKKSIVTRGNADLEAEQKRIATLGEKAKNLKQLLAEVAAERRRAETERAKQAAAEEAERKRQEELRRKPRMVFAEAKGKLEYPAQGQIMRRFGDKDALGGSTQGLMIATRQGAQVTTPVDGKVEFAGPFRSYGQLLIVNPGGGYRVLMAGLDKVTAATGEFLRAGEPVGVMGNGPASVTLFGDVVLDGRPVLYIEFRNSTEAIDSDPWWIGGLREARG
ncbi:MAG TPA: peptidoglycan DD-metalloendopeptidase family protein [Aestuariivirga sp.]|nr:peptidoglycan DD-metalloendopeptidase family protein [Aestuariivirga sp.]